MFNNLSSTISKQKGELFDSNDIKYIMHPNTEINVFENRARKESYILNNHTIKNITYFDSESNIYENKTKRFSNIFEENIAEQFKAMQNNIMNREIPILTKLLSENSFEMGYESIAEKYFNHLSDSYGIIANTILQNIYLQHMYENQNLLKHLLFIIGNLSEDKRGNLELIPLAGLNNPDIEIKDLSVKCFESWGDKRHLPSLIELRDNTTVQWFKDYINDVIEELDED